ncbi:MAG TPA: thiamine pyrophosphate-dependent enzyme [Solirubrobacteraceae bacterium]|jgi:acetolactate synthase-1/2/3 large subunit|nr:thiamine pyrophosphate-dependent enzyme [Solirubrobacteraceae bacterium]
MSSPEGDAARDWSGGAAVAHALAQHGVDVAWGIPGTHNLEIYAHLGAAGIRHVLPRHEQGAGFAADGFARASGRPCVCITTSGPAVLNAATALGQAYSDSVPVLLVSAGMPLRAPGRGNGELHETRDLGAALEGIVACSHRVTSVEEIPVAIAQAFASMATGRSRPRHVEIPFDVLEERAPAVPVAPVLPAVADPDPRALAAAADLLATARRPAVVAGGGALDAAPVLTAFAERLAAPVVTTFNGKGALDEDHPLSGGAGLHRRPVHALVAESDVLVVVGSELAPADLWEGPLPRGPRIVRIDVDPAQTVTNALPDAAVVGDAGRVLAGLLPRMTGSRADRDRALAAAELSRADARAAGARWDWLLDGIGAGLGRDGVLAGDSAMVCYHGAAARVRRHVPRTFLYPTGFGTLGYGLPAAIGAKLARPDARVLALLGDGGVMFTIAELASAAALGLGLPVVVVDNGGYGEIRAEMRARGDEPVAVDIAAPDFLAVARGLGCDAVHVAAAEELEAALEGAFAATHPTLVHVRDDS